MKRCKKVCAGLCAGAMIAEAVLAPVPAYAKEKENTDIWSYETSWEEVSGLLDKHRGIYEEPSSFDPKTKHTPDAPLMGNGTVLGFLAGESTGDAKKQTIYLSRLDNFEELNRNSRDLQYVGYGGIDIERTDAPQESVSDFSMEEDMKLAEVKGVSEDGFQTETWISAKENIVVSEITNLTDQPMELDISVWTNVTDKVGEGEDAISHVDAGVDDAQNLIYASRQTGSKIYNWSVNSTTAVRLVGEEAAAASMEKVDNHTSKFGVKLDGNNSIYMVAAVEGGKDSKTYQEDAVDKAMSIDSEQKIEKAKQVHQDWWKDYWMKSYIDLDDQSESIEKLYYGQMYQIGCALQGESENPAENVTAGLFPWTGSSAPDWQGDYTLNSDVQRAIGVAITANRLNHIDNYTGVIQDYWSVGAENAKNPQHLNWLISGSDHKQFTEGIRGSLYPTHIGPWGSRTEHFNAPNDYFCSPANGTMVLQPLIQYYKSTLDENYLQNTLYPMVKEQANFWVDYAEKDANTGKYNIYGATYESWNAYKNATLDLASAEFMLKNAIAFSEHLGVDTDLCAQWKEVHDNLAEYPTKNGYYIEDERGADPTTTSCFNVYGFAFYDLVGPSSSQEEKDKILLWLENKQEFGTSDKQTRAAMTSARVGFDPHIWLDKMKAGYVDRTPDDWMGIRPNNTIGDVGASLFSGAIMESMVQSHEGFINFFPAWYEDQEASFKNIRAYGAFTVSGKQNVYGQVEGVAIHSEKGADCSVLNPWQAEGLEVKVLKDGKEVETAVKENSLGDVYTFKTEAGADYELIPSKELPGVINIKNTDEEVFIEDTLQLEVNTNVEKVAWKSSDEDIAKVENGVVTPKKLGEVEITAYEEGNEAVSDTCTVHITDSVKIPSEQLRAIADSEEGQGGDGPASDAVDGDTSTKWHSGYSDGKIKPDIPNNKNNTITIDLGETAKVGKLEYVPRQDSTPNGRILKYEIWCSEDAEGEEFTKVSEGSWEDSAETKTAEFNPISARRIRVRAMSTAPRDEFITAVEFYIYKKAEAKGDITKVLTEIKPIQVVEGTSWKELKDLLPKEVEVELATGMKTTLEVKWNPDNYTGASGTMTGELAVSGKVQNPKNIEAKAEITVVKADKELLRSLYDQYADMEQGLYTNDSWKALQQALKEAKTVLDQEDVPVREVAEATTNLQAAIDGLKEIKGVEITEEEVTAYVGIPKALDIRSSVETPLVWESEDKEVATVDENGVITPVKAGTTSITVSAEGTEYTDTCEVTVLKNEKNYMEDKPEFASSGHHDNFVPENVADGKTGGNGTESAAYAWVSPNVPINQERWITVEFPEPVTINKWRVTHVDKDGDGGSITKDFELQVSENGQDWETVDTVKDNTELITERYFNSDDKTLPSDNKEITSRYFRLYITAADNYNGQWPNNMARIDEWELLYEYGNYNVEFHPGEGSGEIYTQEIRHNEEKALEKNRFSKEGYVFTGWADEKGNLYTDGQEVFNLVAKNGETVVLTAQWRPIEYQIIYDLNQGEGKTPEAVKCVYDTEVTLAPVDGITRDGYKIIGWNTREDGSGTDYKGGDVVSNLTVKDGENVVLYAKWEKTETEGSIDKSALKNIVDKASEVDVKLYTEESVKAFEEALKQAETLLADETLGAKDQEKVDAAVKALQQAMDALELKTGDNGNGDGNNTGDGSANTGDNSNGNNVDDNNGTAGGNSQNNSDNSPKTGDTVSLVFPIAGIGISVILAGVALISYMRRKRK